VDEPGFAKAATIQEIGAKGWSLSIPLYIERVRAAPAASAGEGTALADAWLAWEANESGFWTEMDAVTDLLATLATADQTGDSE
jgi:type I restriction enzyme M protein